MNDCELLEMAGKAAGIEGHDGIRGDGTWWWYNSCMDAVGRTWNPLADDGDALRLAVDLGIKIRWHAVLNQALAWPGSITEVVELQENGENHSGDKFAATRCAIVRAAAEIGRAMP